MTIYDLTDLYLDPQRRETAEPGDHPERRYMVYGLFQALLREGATVVWLTDTRANRHRYRHKPRKPIGDWINTVINAEIRSRSAKADISFKLGGFTSNDGFHAHRSGGFSLRLEIDGDVFEGEFTPDNLRRMGAHLDDLWLMLRSHLMNVAVLALATAEAGNDKLLREA